MKRTFMKRPFCFAIGNIWRWDKGKNRAKLIDSIIKLDVSGVELTIGYKKELYNFRLNPQQIRWLRKLDYVSIHAPFRMVRKAEHEEEIIKQLDLIQKIYNQVKAKNVILHPNDLPTKKILDHYNMKFSIENLPPNRNVTIKKIKAILKKYPKIGLCVDVAHAYLWSRSWTGDLVKNFKNKITQVHFSGTCRKIDHLSLRKVSPIFLKSIQPLKKLNVPIVIEEDMKVKSLNFVRDEIKYIKSLF